MIIENFEDSDELAKALYRYPKLASHIKRGNILYDGAEFYGVASDSITVSLGNDPYQVEMYLNTYSTPDMW